MFMHGIDEHASGRGERGVSIITSLALKKHYDLAGGLPPMTTSNSREDLKYGRHIDIKIFIRALIGMSLEAFR